jgi:DNA-binding CsgD family transcriptional regulator
MTDRFDRLTPRQRECLRLVHAGNRSKEIARLLGISSDRVDEIVKDAMQRTGLNPRNLAARLFVEHEAASAHPPSSGAPPSGGAIDDRLRPDRPADTSPATKVVEWVAEAKDRQAPFLSDPDWLSALPLPLPTSGRTRNDLTPIQTTIAIIVIAILGAGAAGAIVSFVITLNSLVVGYHHGTIGP